MDVQDGESTSTLKIVNGTFAWSSEKPGQTGGQIGDEATGFRLIDVNLEIQPGVVTVITGEVGSGKTALLVALLGEMRCLAGTVQTPRSSWLKDGLSNTCAYAAQTPWIESGIIRDIILFGSPYEEERYNLSLAACCLEEDLELFDDGDRTEIGKCPL